jgi:hypothetical protein
LKHDQNPMDKRFVKELMVFVALVALIVVARFLPHAANFAPAAAAGLFAGYFFRSRLVAIAVPLLGMMMSDMLFAGAYNYSVMAVVYIAMALPALAGPLLRKVEGSATRKSIFVLLGAAGCSVLFFVATNFAVWMFDGMYAQNATGFAACYAAAVPFFRWTLAGDLFFAVTLFGVHALATRLMASKAAKWATA